MRVLGLKLPNIFKKSAKRRIGSRFAARGRNATASASLAGNNDDLTRMLQAAHDGDLSQLKGLGACLSLCSIDDAPTMRSLLNPLGRAGLAGYQVMVWARLLALSEVAQDNLQRALRLSVLALAPDAQSHAPVDAVHTATGAVVDAVLKAADSSDPAWAGKLIQAASAIDPLATSKRSTAVIASLSPAVTAKSILRLQEGWPAINTKWAWAFYTEFRRIGRRREAETLVASISSSNPLQGRYFFRLVLAKAERRAFAEAVRDLLSSQGGLMTVKEMTSVLRLVPPSTPVPSSSKVHVGHAMRLYLGCAHDGRQGQLQALASGILQARPAAELIYVGMDVFRAEFARSPGIEWGEVLLSLDDIVRGAGRVLSDWAVASADWAGRAKAGQTLASYVSRRWRDDATSVRKVRIGASLMGVYPVESLDGPVPPIRSTLAERKVGATKILLTFSELRSEISSYLASTGAEYRELRVGAVAAKERMKDVPDTVIDVGFGANTEEDYESADIAARLSRPLTEGLCGVRASRRKREQEVIRLLVEDRIYPGIIYLKKLLHHLRDAEEDNITLVIDGANYVYGLQVACFLRMMGFDRLLLIFDVFGAPLAEIQEAWARAPESLKDLVLNLVSASLEEGKEETINLDRWLPTLSKMESSTSGECGGRGAASNVLVTTSLGDSSYFSSSLAIVGALSGICNITVYNGAAKGSDRFAEASGVPSDSILSRYPAMDLVEANTKAATKRMFKRFETLWSGSEEDAYFVGNASRFLKVIPLITAQEISQAIRLREVLSDGKIDALVTVPGRMISSRAATIDAQMLGIPTLDLQAFFISPHPRYHPSIADIYAGITEDQLDVYRAKNPPRSQELRRIGSLMIGEQLSRVRDMSVQEAREQCGIPADRPMIVFGAQHGQGAEGEEIIRMIVRAATTVDDSLLVVKLHPRTSSEGVASIQALVDKEARGEVRVQREGDIYALMRAADLVVTQFSNVGLEAAMMGRPVISVNLTGQDYVVDLARLGVAVRATNEDDLKTKVHALLKDEEARSVLDESRKVYLEQNPELRDLSAANEVRALVKGLLGMPASEREAA